MAPIKVVQIATAPEVLLALKSDGTIWMAPVRLLTAAQQFAWVELPSVPQGVTHA
jgi:hypothetical protein